MSRDADYLRTLGMTDEQITKLQAELDQHKAEADHLIDHAIRLHRGSLPEAALEAAAIRDHLADHDERHLRGVLSCILSRAGQLTATVEALSRDLTTALAAAREAQA